MKKLLLILLNIMICITLINCTGIKKIHEDPIIPTSAFDNIIEKEVTPITFNPNFGGKVFCDYMIIDSEKEDDIIKIYINLYAQEYYKKNGELQLGTGEITPAVLTIKEDNDNYECINCDIPQEIETKESIKDFPKKIQKEYLHAGSFSGQSETTAEEKARKYFNL